MHKDDGNYVGWLLFYGMKAKSRDIEVWRQINARKAAEREVRVRQEYNEKYAAKE